MIDHQTVRQQRRTNATEQLMRQVACRQKAFDSLDRLDAALAALSEMAATSDDPLTRAERVIDLAGHVSAGIEQLRRDAADVRNLEHIKPAEIAEMLDVPRARLFRRAVSASDTSSVE